MSKHLIHPIANFRGPATKTGMTYRVGDGQTVDCVGYIWYVEGPKEKIIVDAGSTAEELASRGFSGMKELQSPEDGLRKFGLKPSDIDIVIITHLHGDHIALAHKYTKAKFIVQRTEIGEAYYPHPLGAPGYRPFGKSFKSYEDLNYEVIEGDKKKLYKARKIWVKYKKGGFGNERINKKMVFSYWGGPFFDLRRSNIARSGGGIGVEMAS
jgi:glyoxylase-like metal-dependent hydrolase (beta-lactamase superfamily II)